MAETLMQEEECGEPRKNGFEREDYGGVRRRQVLLRPTLNGEGGSGRDHAGDEKRDDKARSEVGVGMLREREGDQRHDCRDADLERGKLRGWQSRGSVSEREKVSREGDGASEREQIA